MRPRMITTLAAVAAAGLLLAGCSSDPISGGSTNAPENGGSDELTTISVGVLPIAPTAAIQLGVDEGIFAEHGIELKLESGQGGAALLPAVSSGSIDFAVGNPLSVLIAASQGLDMRIVGGYAQIDTPPGGAALVMPDSGIETWADLEGKTVAVNALNTQADLTIMAQVDADGGDSTKVTFTEIPFPDQLPQLEQNHIDVAWVPEPFLGNAVNAGAEILGDPQIAIDPNAYTLVTFTSGALVERDPEVVERFIAALAETMDFVTANEQAYRTAVAEFTGMPQETADAIGIELFSASLNRGIIESTSDMAYEYGFLESQPDLDTVIWTP